MFYSGERLPDGRFSLDVTRPPGLRADQIDMNNERNKIWNLNTLTLMARAKIIELDSASPPSPRGSELTDEEVQEAFQAFQDKCVVRILNQQHTERETWDTVIEETREEAQKASHKSFDLLRTALRGSKCVAEIFEQAYTIPSSEVSGAYTSVTVSKSCGGCPYCRKTNQTPYAGQMYSPKPVWDEPYFQVDSELQRIMAQQSILAIFYADQTNSTELERSLDIAIRWLSGGGSQRTRR